MSINAINYAANLRRRTDWAPTKKLIFWHLCDQANSDTWSWDIASLEDLGQKADTTIRSVSAALKEFQHEGIITYTPKVGWKGQDIKGFTFTIHKEALDRIMDRPADWNQQQKSTKKDTKPAPESGSENISDPTRSLWITGSENISDPANTGSENPSYPVGSEKNDTVHVENFRPQRARTSSSHSETILSSSSPPQTDKTLENLKEPLARREDEEESSSPMQQPVAAASGTANPVYTHPVHGRVKLADVQQALQETSPTTVPTAQIAQQVAERILARSGDEPKYSPTGYVVAAIKRDPRRSLHDLETVSIPDQHQMTGADPQGQSKPVPCPIPAHAINGHRQHNCPDCLDKTGAGEFPEAITSEIYDQLSPEGQGNINRHQVPIKAYVDPVILERSVSWREKVQAA